MPTNVLVLNKSWVVTGAGEPEGQHPAPVGSIYMREEGAVGTSFYIKEAGSGNTGWKAVGAPAVPPTLHHTTHEPGGTDVLTVAAWTDRTNTFLAQQRITATTPLLTLVAASAQADAKRFDLAVAADGSRFDILALTDAAVVIGSAQFSRVGNLVLSGALTTTALDLKEGVPLDPPADTARLYSLDVNGYTQVEMRDGAAKVVRFASDNILIAKVTGVAVTRGQCIFLAGASGANPLAGLARSDDIATMPCVGLALDSGAVNAFIRVLLAGTLQLIDTSAFAEGASLFVSPTTAGSMTTTLPGFPAFAQRAGFVTRSHATQGEVLVMTTAVDPPPRLHAPSHERFDGNTDQLDVTRLGGFPNLANLFLRGDGTFSALPPVEAHAATHGQAGSDALPVTSLAGFSDATKFLRGDRAWTVVKTDVSAASRLIGRGASGAGAMEEIVLGTGLTMSGTTLNAEGGSTLPPYIAYTNVWNSFTTGQEILGDLTLSNANPSVYYIETDAPANLKNWVFGVETQLFRIMPCDDAWGSNVVALSLNRSGDVTVGRNLTVTNDAYVNAELTVARSLPRIRLNNTAGAADGKNFSMDAWVGNVYLYMLNDANSAQVSNPLILYRDGTVQVTGNNVGLRFGGTTSAYPALRRAPAGGAVLEVTTAESPASLYATMKAGNFIATNSGNNLADLTCGATNFQAGVTVTAGGANVTGLVTLNSGCNLTGTLLVNTVTVNSGALTVNPGVTNLYGRVTMFGGSTGAYNVAPLEIQMAANPRVSFHWPGVVASQIGMDSAGVIRTYDNPGTGYASFMAGSIQSSTNTWISNIHTTGYVYPGVYSGTAGSQVSWFFGGHSGYGIYCNTGLYVEAGGYFNFIEGRTHVRAAAGLYDYARGTPIGGWVAFAVGQGNFWSNTQNPLNWGSADYVYTLVGSTCIVSVYYAGGANVASSYLYCHLPVTAARANQTSVWAYWNTTTIASQGPMMCTTTAGANYLTFFSFGGGGFPAGAFQMRGQIAVQF